MANKYFETAKNELSTKEIFEYAKDKAYQYIDNIEEKPVFPTEEDLKKLKVFDENLPQTGQDALEIIKQLNENGAPNTTASTGGRYFGFVLGGALPVTQAVRWLADVWDQNAAVGLMSPVAAKIEEITAGWLLELFGLPETGGVGFVTGSASANLCALTTARNTLLKRLGWDLKEKGMHGSPKLKVVLSDQAHATIYKALYLLGFGDKDIIRVESDGEGRIKLERMPELDNKTIVVLQASNLVTGSYENFDTICKLANDAGSWVHIDGAFGLWAAVSPKLYHLTEGFELADSWATDFHKTLNTTYDGAMVAVKQKEDLINTMQAQGDYLDFSGGRNGMVYTLDMSRRARFEVWAALKYLGKEGIAKMVEGMVENAEYFGELLQKAEFHIVNDIVFNQVLFCGESDEETNFVLEQIQKSGVLWCGKARWQNRDAIRISVSSWATSKKDVEMSAKTFAEAKKTFDAKNF